MKNYCIKTTTNILLFIFSGIVALYVAETLWRIIKPGYGDLPRRYDQEVFFTDPPLQQWEIHSTEYNVHMRTNSKGFRGAEFPDSEQKTIPRIVIIGDSFVEARQVEEENRFPDLIATRLKDKAEIVTIGLDGAHLLQELQYLRHFALPMNPDLVLLCLFIENDAIFPEGKGEMRLQEIDGKTYAEKIIVPPNRPYNWREKIGRKFTIIQAAYHALKNISQPYDKKTAKQELASFWWHTKEGQETMLEKGVWESTMTALRTFQKDTKDAGVEFAVILIPSAIEIHNDWWDELQNKYQPNLMPEDWDTSTLNTKIANLLSQEKIQIINLRSVFEKEGKKEKLFFKTDAHFNVAGHILASNNILTWLQTHAIIEKYSAKNAEKETLKIQWKQL